MSEKWLQLHHVRFGKWSAEEIVKCPHCRKGILVEYQRLEGDSDYLCERFAKEKTKKSRKEKT